MYFKASTNMRCLYNVTVHTLSCILLLLAIMTPASQAFKRSIRREGHFPGNPVDMDGLNRLLETLDSHLETFQKRTCAVGIQSHNCIMSDLSDMMRSKAYLSSGYSPGKRSMTNGEGQGQGMAAIPDNVLEEAKALQKDITEQRQVIWRLKTLLRAVHQGTEDNRVNSIQKKSCSFRLGGHCLTEELDRAATQYYYLKSPDSPGRRRRSPKSSIKQVVGIPSSLNGHGSEKMRNANQKLRR